MKYKISLFIISLLLSNTLCAQHIIWQLGVNDGKPNEFALFPNEKDKFVEAEFGSEGSFFYADEVKPSEFPYILPGPMAEWAGGTYWAGQTRLRLPVYIKLSGVNIDEEYKFRIMLSEIGFEDKMFLRLEVNGIRYDGNIAKDDKSIEYKIQGNILNEGINKFVIQLFNGQYITFDAFTFSGSPKTTLQPIGNKSIINLSIADYELNTDGVNVQPLLVETISRKNAEIRIEAGSSSFTKHIEKGKAIYEIPLKAVKEEYKTQVKVFENGINIAEQTLVRSPQKTRRNIDYVNQFAGSSGSRWMIGPGPWMPFGMVKIMPDNEDFHWKAGYEYNVENIMGFSHIHEWTMAGLLMIPTTGKLQIQPGTEKYPELGYRSRIDKTTEQAEIGYYSVDLTDYDIQAELTATTRASLQKYTFNKSNNARILVDFFFPSEYAWTLKDLYVKKVSDTEIEGWTLNNCHSTGYHGVQDYKLHFVMQFDKPFTSMNGWIQDEIYTNIDKLTKDINIAGNPWTISYKKKEEVGDAGLFLNFDFQNGESVMVRTGISLVSTDNARLNLEEELAKPFAWNFQAVVDNQKTVWNKLFETVQITTDDYLQKEKFYTNLYRAISPRTVWNDINGEWMDMNGDIAQVEKKDKNVYGGDALWGTHWTLNPFYNLLYPEYMSNWIYTHEEFYKRGGWFPHGNPGMKYFRVMVGSPAIPMIVSGYQHGIRDFDTNLLYKGIMHQQTSTMINYPKGGQVGNESYPDYIEKGYVPLYKDMWNWDSLNFHSYVSNTMEYAYQDYCAAQYVKLFGGHDEYNTLMRRSDNWKNIFDTSTGYVRPRYPDGNWIENKDPYKAPGFCEGSAWQFTWYVPHNVQGLIDILGEKTFISRLNEGFEKSQYVNFNALGDNMSAYPINHGNETNMQAAYLFNFTSEPWHTQRWVRAIQEQYYGVGPRDAYPGDEDQGQMSSWYVLSSVGLFQMDGGCTDNPVWTFGSPRFQKVEIKLDDRYYSGNKLVIEALNASKENCYIQSVSFNGKRISKPFINWSKLKQGGKLQFVMGNKPNTKAFK